MILLLSLKFGRPNDSSDLVDLSNATFHRLAEQELKQQCIMRKEFSSTNIQLMSDTRALMNQQEHTWALFSFNNVQNQNGCNGGVYEIMESNDIIYICALQPGVHIRDALNAHFSGNDRLPLGAYLSHQKGDLRKFSVRFMLSQNPKEDTRLLLRHYQLNSQGRVPKFN